jgi:hypothetical protein
MLPGYVAGFYDYQQTHINLERLARASQAQWHLDRVVGLDLQKNQVLCTNHPPISFDYLSIDTEGNDMQVLLGAIGLLSSHSIRFFEFEHHTVARWITSSLRDLIELVDSMGYDCYWTMNSGKLARLTGCWNDAYLFKRWSNVACISRRDSKGHDFMESLAAL